MNFFKDESGQLSMGRLISFIAALNGVVVFTVKTFTSTDDIGVNVMNGCIFMIATAIGGKALQTFGEKMGKK
jgi:hypothetical protein